MAEKTVVAAVAEVNDLKESISNLKQEINDALSALNDFGRVGSLSMRSLGSETRGLQSSFRDISREFRRLSTPSSPVGAAATSQALGALTGGGRPGAAGVSGGGAGLGQMGFPLSQGVGGIAGSLAAAPFQLGGAGLQAGGLAMLGRGNLLTGGLLYGAGKMLGWTGKKAGGITAAAGSAALSAGMGFVQQGISRRTALESMGRELGGGWLTPGNILPKPAGFAEMQAAGWKPPLPGAAAEASKFGYNVEDVFRGAAGLRFTAPTGRGSAREEMANLYGKTLVPYGSGANFGVGPGALAQIPQMLAPGGLGGAGPTGAVLAGAQQAYGGMGDESRGREMIGLLSAMSGTLSAIYAIEGKYQPEQVASIQKLYNALQKGPGFTPEAAAGITAQLTQAARAPGGGVAGEIAYLQTLGFGNPNMEGLKRQAKQMGLSKKAIEFLKPRGYLEAQEAKERMDPFVGSELLRLTASNFGEEGGRGYAYALSQLMRQPFAKTLDIAKLGTPGGTTFGGGGSGPKAATGKFAEDIKLVQATNVMIHASLSQNTKALTQVVAALTEVKTGMAGIVKDVLTELPGKMGTIVKDLKKGLTDLGVLSGTTKDTMDHIETKSEETKTTWDEIMAMTDKLLRRLKSD